MVHVVHRAGQQGRQLLQGGEHALQQKAPVIRDESIEAYGHKAFQYWRKVVWSYFGS